MKTFIKMVENIEQEWVCIIISLNQESIQIEMHDLTNAGSPIEIAELKISKFNLDSSSLSIGQVFLWQIGYETLPHGQIINFSRFEPVTQKKLSIEDKFDILRKSKEIFDILNG